MRDCCQCFCCRATLLTHSISPSLLPLSLLPTFAGLGPGGDSVVDGPPCASLPARVQGSLSKVRHDLSSVPDWQQAPGLHGAPQQSKQDGTWVSTTPVCTTRCRRALCAHIESIEPCVVVLTTLEMLMVPLQSMVCVWHQQVPDRQERKGSHFHRRNAARRNVHLTIHHAGHFRSRTPAPPTCTSISSLRHGPCASTAARAF